MKAFKKIFAATALAALLGGAISHVSAETLDVDTLKEGQSINYRVFMTKGETVTYGVAGDDDAQDIDIRVIDPDGDVIEQDVLDDAEPEVTFRAWRSGTYIIRVTMVDSRHGVPVVVALYRD